MFFFSALADDTELSRSLIRLESERTIVEQKILKLEQKLRIGKHFKERVEWLKSRPAYLTEEEMEDEKEELKSKKFSFFETLRRFLPHTVCAIRSTCQYSRSHHM